MQASYSLNGLIFDTIASDKNPLVCNLACLPTGLEFPFLEFMA